jgi:hypothetical protein
MRGYQTNPVYDEDDVYENQYHKYDEIVAFI